MSLLQRPRTCPRVLLFDWHATLADTMDAMYHAVDDVLPKLVELGLVERLVKAGESKTVEDAKLVKYIRDNAQLHPKIKADRKISRTDIFEVLFGADKDAKATAHRIFDQCYRNHFGEIKPYEPGIRDILEQLRGMNMKLGVISNRKREYMLHEVSVIEGNGWNDLFDTMACGDDVEHRKPAPDLLLKALENLGIAPSHSCWYIGDSTTDIVAADRAGVTPIFYNGAQWSPEWLDKIFPNTVRHPHRPEAVVNHFPELLDLVRYFIYDLGCGITPKRHSGPTQAK